MQTHKDGDVESRADRTVSRFFESIADLFSPKLRCDECGIDSRRRRYHKTGVTRPMPDDEEWSRWATVEIEHVCPHCGASVWVQEIPVYYSYV